MSAAWLRTVIFAALAFYWVGSVPAQPKAMPAAKAEPNAVFIVNVSPETLVDGVETEVEMTVAYELVSHDRAVIELTSNALRAQSMSVFASQAVARGSGTVTIKGKLTPRHWGNIVPARAGVFLVGMDEQAMQRKVLASDQTRVTLTLRSGAPETQATNPNPREVFEDGVRIKSVSPESFVAGQRTEVTVVVGYELLSREEAEIQVGFSRGAGSGFTVNPQPTRVKMGKGEVTVKAWVTPQRTGSLPYGKVHVNLSEYPRRARHSPLATDAETVEVR